MLLKFNENVDLESYFFVAYSTPPMEVCTSEPNISCSPIPTSGCTSNANLLPTINSVRFATSPLVDAKCQSVVDAEVNSLTLQPAEKSDVISIAEPKVFVA